MNVSDFIFRFLEKKGVDTAFMVSGGQAMFLCDALARNKSFEVICTHHEQSAAMSADAFGRLTNRPAVALVTAGPGSVNAMNGVVGGYTDSSPMIVISGQANLSFVKYQEKTGIRQFGVQGVNIRPFVEPVVKYFITIDDPHRILFYMEKAYYEATSGRPGPVWIDVPLDMQKAAIDEDKLESFVPEKYHEGRNSKRQAVTHTYERLLQAKRPVLLVGQGVALSGAREVFRQVAETLRIPVITSRLGIDLIETENELYVGRPGNYGERSANFAIQNADLIVSIGCRMASSLVGHAPQQFGKHAYKIVVDIDQKELDKPGVHIDYKAMMDCLEYLECMKEEASEYVIPKWDDWIAQCNTWKRDYPVVQSAYKDEKPVNSYYFTDRLSELAGSDANILVDTGSCFHVACQVWKVKPGQRFLTTGGLSSMGYWVAGIGACMANNRKPTIVITGDGSLQMNIQEFATIRHNNLPIKVVIFNNNGYLLIRHTQRNFMEDRLFGEGPESGVWCPDAMKIGEAYGIKSLRINSADEVDERIREALDYDGPLILEVMTPEWQLLIPRISSDKLPDGTLVAKNYEDMFPFLPPEEVRRNMVADI